MKHFYTMITATGLLFNSVAFAEEHHLAHHHQPGYADAADGYYADPGYASRSWENDGGDAGVANDGSYDNSCFIDRPRYDDYTFQGEPHDGH